MRTDSLRSLIVAAGLLLPTSAPMCGEVIWGANGHPLVSYPGVPIEDQLDLLKDLGMKSYRVDVYRMETIPDLERIIDEAELRDLEVLPILIPPVNLEKDDEEKLYETSRAFASTFVRHFGERVAVWELGNEMEIFALIKPCEMQDDGKQYPCEWGIAGGVGPLDYYGPRYVKVAAVLRGLSEGVRDASPTARRAIGTAGWGHLGIFERLRNDGVPWDITVWHMYGGNPVEEFKALATYGKPIWVTEMNHPYGSQKGEREQAYGLGRLMKCLDAVSETYKIEAVHIYELLDEPYWAPDYEAYMGLVQLVPTPGGGYSIGARKPAYDVAKQIIAEGAGPEQEGFCVEK